MKTFKKARVEIMKTQHEPVMVVEFYVECHRRKYVKHIITGRYELYGPGKLTDLVRKHPDQKFRVTRRVFVDPRHMPENAVEQFCSKMWNLQM